MLEKGFKITIIKAGEANDYLTFTEQALQENKVILVIIQAMQGTK